MANRGMAILPTAMLSTYPQLDIICSSSILANALDRPWLKGEQLIAEALEISVREIWPSRYFNSQGQLVP